MQVFISADMEGCTGIADPRDVLKPEDDYPLGRELMVGDVNAAIDGAIEAGAEEITVNDSHWTMTNIKQTELRDEARLIRGSTKRRLMTQGLTEEFDVAFFIGYHGKAGTPGAVLNHTLFPQMLVELRVNDIEVGELGFNTGLAWELGVPVGVVSGDDKTAEEAHDILGENQVETAVVKEGIDRFTANSLPEPEARSQIKKSAQAGVKRAESNDFDQGSFETPVSVEVDWSATNHAYRAQNLAGVERIGGRTTKVEADTYAEAYDAALAMINAASAAHNRMFTW